MEAERQRVSDRLGADPWDAAWLFTTYGLSMETLPSDWRMFGMDEAVVQAIGLELNHYIPGTLGGTDE
jgi:hypothetical protein